MRHRLLEWTLTRASTPEGVGLAARLPSMERAVARTPSGAELACRLADDERWTARFLAGRTLGRMVPDLVAVDEAWARLLTLAGDAVPTVREAVPVGLAQVAERDPSAGERLERLLVDPATPRPVRRAALRSLIPLTLSPATRSLGERLLRAAALADDGLNRGVGAVILGRGIGARDPDQARRIADAWAASSQAPLRLQAARALRGPLGGGDASAEPEDELDAAATEPQGELRALRRTTSEAA